MSIGGKHLDPEELAQDPRALAASARIVAACAQLSASVQRPFVTLCDAAMSVSTRFATAPARFELKCSDGTVPFASMSPLP